MRRRGREGREEEERGRVGGICSQTFFYRVTCAVGWAYLYIAFLLLIYSLLLYFSYFIYQNWVLFFFDYWHLQQQDTLGRVVRDSDAAGGARQLVRSHVQCQQHCRPAKD